MLNWAVEKESSNFGSNKSKMPKYLMMKEDMK